MSPNPIHLLKGERSVEPAIVVIMTIIMPTVLKKGAFSVSICKERAKAIIPLISPVYQKSFLSVFAKGNYLPLILKSRGRMEMLRNLITGISTIKSNASPMALNENVIERTEAPRKAKMKAWKRYLIESKAKTVPWRDY